MESKTLEPIVSEPSVPAAKVGYRRAGRLIKNSVMGVISSATMPRSQTRAEGALMREQRKARRHQYVVLGTVLRQDGRFVTDMMVENVSVGGLAFRSNQPFKVGDRPLLEFTIKGIAHQVSVTVRRLFGANSLRMPHGCGVEYLNPQGELAQEVGCLLEESPGSAGFAFTDKSAA